MLERSAEIPPILDDINVNRLVCSTEFRLFVFPLMSLGPEF